MGFMSFFTSRVNGSLNLFVGEVIVFHVLFVVDFAYSDYRKIASNSALSCSCVSFALSMIPMPSSRFAVMKASLLLACLTLVFLPDRHVNSADW